MKQRQTCARKQKPQLTDRTKGLQSFNSQLLPIYSPSTPAQGENSSADPSHLGPGLFQRLTNLRYSNSELCVRNGSTALTSAPPITNGLYRGSFAGVLDGTFQMFVAYRASGATRVFKVNNLSTTNYTYTEITAGSGNPRDETAAEAGTNNGTRFTADGFISFAIVSDSLGPNPIDILVFGNGINAPRVYCAAVDLFGASSLTATHGTVAKAPAESVRQVPDVAGYIDIRKSSATTAGAATGTATLTKTTLAGEVYYTVDTGASTGTATITLSGANAAWRHDGDFWASRTTLKLNDGKQIILVCKDSFSDPIWNYCKLIATTDAGDVTLYDPTTAQYSAPLYFQIDNGQYLVAFNLEDSDVDQSSISATTGIKFTFATALTAARNFDVYGIMCGGFVPSVSQYSVSYIDSKSRSESGGTVAVRIKSPMFGGISGRGCAIAKVTTRIPITDRLFLRHDISYIDTALSLRVDYAMLYRKEQSEVEYTFVTVMRIPRENTFFGRSTFSDTTKSSMRNITRVSPLGSNVSTPYASYYLGVNRRLYAANLASAKGELWISSDRAPFRFSQSASVTGSTAAKNPAYHRIQGEIIQGMCNLPGQYYGSAPVLIFTNQRIYRIEGIDALSLSRATAVLNIGCSVPGSIAQYNGQVFYVGSDRQVWRYGTGSDGPISLFTLDERIRLSDLTASAASASLYGYQLSIIESPDITPKSILRFDALRSQWGSDSFKTGVVGMLTLDNNAERRLLYFGSDGLIYWFDRAGQTQDGGTDFGINIVTREIHADMWPKMEFSELGMVATIPSAYRPKFTITKYGTQKGAGVTSELDFTGAIGARVYREDIKTPIDPGGRSMVEDVGCVVTIAGNAPGGTQIQSIVLNVKQTTEDADVYRP